MVRRASTTAPARSATELETAPLVEPQSIEVVVRRRQPDPPAAGIASDLDHPLEQAGADPDAPRLRGDGHELAAIWTDPIRRMAGDPVSVHRHEPRQLGRSDPLPVRDDEVRVPRVDHMDAQPIRRHVRGGQDLHRP